MNNIYKLNNEYMNEVPNAYVITQRLNQLISHYKRHNVVYCLKDNNYNTELARHLNNLRLTYCPACPSDWSNYLMLVFSKIELGIKAA